MEERNGNVDNQQPVVGVIGCGFVGNAVAKGFEARLRVLRYDIDPDKCECSFEELCKQSTFAFVCVPTPTAHGTHKAELLYVAKVLQQLEDVAYCGIVIVKSTMPPGSMESFLDHFTYLNLVYNPEFLSERTAVVDFKTAARVVLGGPEHETKEVAELYTQYLRSDVQVIQTDYATAQLTKYACNCLYAVKIAMFNELRQLSDKLGCQWDDVMRGILFSRWVNPMHTRVPGPDGKFGFGGKCFPKDLLAMITCAYENGVPPRMMEAAWQKNLEVRPDRDWEIIEGAIE